MRERSDVTYFFIVQEIKKRNKLRKIDKIKRKSK